MNMMMMIIIISTNLFGPVEVSLGGEILRGFSHVWLHLLEMVCCTLIVEGSE